MKMRNLIFTLLKYSGLPLLARRMLQKSKVTIFIFHNPKNEVFLNSILYLNKYYNIVTLKDYIKVKNNSLSLPDYSVIITFDDGWKENYQLLPIIKKYKVPVTIFICSDLIGTNKHFWFTSVANSLSRSKLKRISNKDRVRALIDYGVDIEKDHGIMNRQILNIAEIKEMINTGLVDFQSHTKTHPILNRCTTDDSKKEIEKSKEGIEQITGKQVYALAFPNGDFSNREVELCKNSGYLCSLTIKPGFNSLVTDSFRLKRLGVRDTASYNEIIVKMSGLWGWVLMLRNLFRVC